MIFIFEENPSAPNEKDSAFLRELRKRVRGPNKIEPLKSLPFPPKFDERIFLRNKTNMRFKTKAANGWFFYRKAYVEELKANGRTYPMTEISKHIAELWKNEPEKVRKFYKELASKAADLHHQVYGNDLSNNNKPPCVKKPKKFKESQMKSEKPSIPIEPKGLSTKLPFNEHYINIVDDENIYSPYLPTTPCLEYNPYDIFYEPQCNNFYTEPVNFLGDNDNDIFNFDNEYFFWQQNLNTMNTE
ncbi:MATA-HMG [Gigaspora margarita]|uniref:MATA-HMG n=1 Tax=Gigaspora margarita TaxID=4874 RepID=A0A8H4AAZ7_GIGMA|nr:MATA-HMG [Gigaspora margarita]